MPSAKPVLQRGVFVLLLEPARALSLWTYISESLRKACLCWHTQLDGDNHPLSLLSSAACFILQDHLCPKVLLSYITWALKMLPSSSHDGNLRERLRNRFKRIRSRSRHISTHATLPLPDTHPDPDIALRYVCSPSLVAPDPPKWTRHVYPVFNIMQWLACV